MASDVVVVGAGHNGLVAANYLADAGLSVTVLERRGVIGGATVTEELIPGFRSSSCAYVVGLLHPRIIRDLQLARHGLELYQTAVADVNLLEDGRHLVLWNDLGATLRELERANPGESERFVTIGLRLQRFAQLIEPWTLTPPPSVDDLRARFERAGEARLFEEFFTLSVGDLLDRYLEHDLLKGLFSFLALVSAWGGPWTPGWSFLYGHHSIGEFNGQMGQYGFPRGGMGAVSASLARRARARGVTIRTESAVSRVLVEEGRAVGVITEAGEELPARAVASNADPVRTFLELLEHGDLPGGFRSEIEGFDMRGSMARVHIALDGLPGFVGMGSGPGPHCRGLTLLGAEIDRFEAAWQAQRRAAIPEDFPIEFVIQSVHDDSLAPAGKHMMMTGIQQLPFELEDGTWDDRRDEFTDRVLDALARYAPRIRDHVIDTHTITPLDLEREYGLTGGNIFHGAMTPAQVFDRRPAQGWSGYRTPVDGLFLCGSGAHPGGGVMGVPGHNAARVIATELARPGEAAPQPSAGDEPIPRTPLVDRLLTRPRSRRALVALARQPWLAPLVERAGRRG
jgi:phytoene dehydrogenase-like protein